MAGVRIGLAPAFASIADAMERGTTAVRHAVRKIIYALIPIDAAIRNHMPSGQPKGAKNIVPLGAVSDAGVSSNQNALKPARPNARTALSGSYEIAESPTFSHAG